MVYSRGVKFSVALRASSAAESPLIYVLLSESSRFKSGVCGQGTISLCVFGCEGKREYESLLLSANTSVRAYLSSDMRTGPNLPRRVPRSTCLRGPPFFDGERV